jgi:hypothetical protein
MNESTKKSATQAALLVVLLLVLGFSAFRMISAMQTTRKPAAKAQPAVERNAADSGKKPTSTNMPHVARTGEAKSKGMEVAEGDLHINPNQFKVYALNPPKNPFVQSEEWYKEELAKLPGYPELKQNDYLDQTVAYLPDIPLIDEGDWEEIMVDRSVKIEPYEISGLSEDGQITTTVRLKPQAPESDSLAWSRASGVPVSALKSPDWKERYGDQLAQGLVPASKDGGFIEDALGVPGDGGSRPAGEMRDGEDGAGNGDALYAVGVSRKGKVATALIRHNGKTRLVREGSVLPTNYQVLTIKENGVVVIDLRDGSSNWLPLGSAPAAGRAEKPKKT